MPNSTLRILIIFAMTLQTLVMCSEFAAPAAHAARDIEPEPAATIAPPAPRVPSRFVACYEPESR